MIKMSILIDCSISSTTRILLSEPIGPNEYVSSNTNFYIFHHPFNLAATAAQPAFPDEALTLTTS